MGVAQVDLVREVKCSAMASSPSYASRSLTAGTSCGAVSSLTPAILHRGDAGQNGKGRASHLGALGDRALGDATYAACRYAAPGSPAPGAAWTLLATVAAVSVTAGSVR